MPAHRRTPNMCSTLYESEKLLKLFNVGAIQGVANGWCWCFGDAVSLAYISLQYSPEKSGCGNFVRVRYMRVRVVPIPPTGTSVPLFYL